MIASATGLALLEVLQDGVDSRGWQPLQQQFMAARHRATDKSIPVATIHVQLSKHRFLILFSAHEVCGAAIIWTRGVSDWSSTIGIRDSASPPIAGLLQDTGSRIQARGRAASHVPWRGEQLRGLVYAPVLK